MFNLFTFGSKLGRTIITLKLCMRSKNYQRKALAREAKFFGFESFSISIQNESENATTTVFRLNRMGRESREVWVRDDVVTSVHHRISSTAHISRVHKHKILIWLIVSRAAWSEPLWCVPFLIESAYEKRNECSFDGNAHNSLSRLKARSQPYTLEIRSACLPKRSLHEKKKTIFRNIRIFQFNS